MKKSDIYRSHNRLKVCKIISLLLFEQEYILDDNSFRKTRFNFSMLENNIFNTYQHSYKGTSSQVKSFISRYHIDLITIQTATIALILTKNINDDEM